MRHEQHRLIAEDAANASLEDILGHVSVQSGERVVQNGELGVRVDGASDRRSLFLPAAQRDTLFADGGIVAVREKIDVRAHARRLQRLMVLVFVVSLAEEDVFAKRHRLHPRRLRDVRHGRVDLNF